MNSVGDIFATLKNKLMYSQYREGLQQAAPGFLYYFFLSPFFSQYRSQLPQVVQQKIQYAKQAYDYIHDHWGFSYSDMNNPQRTGIIDQVLTQNLGMYPDQYLGLLLGLGKDQVRITGLLDTLTKLVGPAAGLVVPGGQAVTAASTGLSLVSKIFGNIVQLNPPTTWKMAFPDVSDWSGWNKAQVGKYVTSINDPLGITGYNGSQFGAAQLASGMQVQYQPTVTASLIPGTNQQVLPSQVQAQPTQASLGSGPKWLIPLMLVGIGGGLLYTFLRHK